MPELSSPPLRRPDHGEPALLLVESLIHEFVAREIIDRRQAVEIVTIALEAQISHCDERDEDAETSPAVAALTRIRSTLAIDGERLDGDGAGFLQAGDGMLPKLDGHV